MTGITVGPRRLHSSSLSHYNWIPGHGPPFALPPSLLKYWEVVKPGGLTAGEGFSALNPTAASHSVGERTDFP